jgi:hypothetical protein
MEIQDIIISDNNKEKKELQNLLYISEQNKIFIEKIKQVNKFYNETLELLAKETKIKHNEINELNEIFIQNNKLFKQILSNLL